MLRFSVAPPLLAAVIVLSAKAHAQDNDKAKDRIAAALEAAKTGYITAVKVANDKLLAAFDKQRTELEADGEINPTERVRLLDQLATEKKAFEENAEKHPTSYKMASAASSYRAAISAAKRECERAFDRAANEYLAQGKNVATAKAVLADKDWFLQQGARRAEGPTGTIKEAIAKYEADMKALRQGIIDALQTQGKLSRQSGDTKLAQRYEEERSQFEATGKFPTSISIRAALDQMLRLRGSLDASYASAIRELSTAKKEETMRILESELAVSKGKFYKTFDKDKLELFTAAPVEYLRNTKWEFGQVGHRPSSLLTLEVRRHLVGKETKKGSPPWRQISGNKNPNESGWRWVNDQLVFRGEKGNPTTKFDKVEIENGRLRMSGPHQTATGKFFFIREVIE
jgi:hypothetical protein